MDKSWPRLHHMAEQMARLVDVSVTLNSTLNLEDLLQLIVETAAEILDCESVSILLYNQQKSQLSLTASTGLNPKQLSEIPFPMNSMAGEIFYGNQPVIVSDVKSDTQHNFVIREHVVIEVANLLGVPMRVRDRPMGVLEAINKREGSFTAADVEILLVIASQAAVALHNARLVKALRDAYTEIQGADLLKTNFLALASHELRTPLGVIIGYATFLQEESAGELSDHAKQVLDSAMQMRTLVDAMTNLNMMRSKEMVMHRVMVPIQLILRGAYSEVETLAEAKGQHVNLNFPETPLPVKCDPEKLTSAFVNLLDNAVRFTPEGGTINVHAMLKPGGDMLVSIQDTGIGIEPDELKKIFNEFYQIEPHTTRKYGGMGIGLPIAKGLVEAHGGRVWAESAGPGKGSTFKVLLPKISTSTLATMTR
jgi:signal transduction histidine kinase